MTGGALLSALTDLWRGLLTGGHEKTVIFESPTSAYPLMAKEVKVGPGGTTTVVLTRYFPRGEPIQGNEDPLL